MINRDDNYCFQILKKGDFFGESDILKCIDFSFFGNIVAETPKVQCLFIPREEFLKIPKFERTQIKKYAENRGDIQMLGLHYSRKYNIDIQEYTNFFV